MTLIAGLELPKFAILIARGDLAVEVGFENLAYIQEDILCLCEAAHIPVILATQILESLAESGLRSHAEIADAIMGQRAECVMIYCTFVSTLQGGSDSSRTMCHNTDTFMLPIFSTAPEINN